MTVLQALFLGALQGVAEFLPVSSSGHLVVMRDFMGITDIPPLFDVMLHVATLVVVIIVFRKRVLGLLVSFGRWIARRHGEEDRENLAMIVPILVATVLTAAVGLFINELDIESHPKIVGALFLVTAAILITTPFLKPRGGYIGMKPWQGAAVGFAQGLGVFPGISRSGITIAASLATGLDREKAGEFSFIISIPAILGALLLTLKDMGELSGAVSTSALLTGIVAAFVVGLVSLVLLLRLIKGGKLYLFAIYLIPFGIFTLIAA